MMASDTILGPVVYNSRTLFLSWTIHAGCDDRTYLIAHIDLCEMDICVQQYAGEETWVVLIDGVASVTGVQNAMSAQVFAVAAVLKELVQRCGNPLVELTTEQQQSARTMMERLHSMTKGISTENSMTEMVQQ